MFWSVTKCLPVLAGMCFVSIPTNPDLPPVPRPELPPVPEIFPLDEDVGVTVDLKMGDRPSKLSMSFKVEEIEDHKYKYTYDIGNQGDYTIGVRYDILDRVSGAEIMLLMLEPGESRKITVENNKQPVYWEGTVQVWLMVRANDWEQDMKKVGAKIDGSFFYPVVGKVKSPVPVGFN